MTLSRAAPRPFGPACCGRRAGGQISASGLGAVEALLRESVKSDDPFVAEAARHLVDAGGKRFRPLLVLLAAQFGDPPRPASCRPPSSSSSPTSRRSTTTT